MHIRYACYCKRYHRAQYRGDYSPLEINYDLKLEYLHDMELSWKLEFFCLFQPLDLGVDYLLFFSWNFFDRSYNTIPEGYRSNIRLHLFHVELLSRDVYRITLNGESFDAEITVTAEGALLATFGGTGHRIFGMDEPLGLRLSVDGVTILM